ncbi:DMT family transporter [Roseococcus suduntuyensis]|uniref:Drug/metabolite transporter (DMT)-like permease n=1 Tax=Roseococcus suduntuyensis TaxID=455361 RepID=A0A840A866_9PROT|nr:DMT family transporter [Roseococcus suduntuyensis]MBB3898258.1 drug/metabolite transporter (DMT)-like permease [Roseococcus suduntuyensis]
MTQRSTGLLLLFVTALCWGSNWPLLKLLLAEMPPLGARAYAGFIAAALVGVIALARGESLAVPREQWGRVWLFALLNVTAWMGFASMALLWLAAGEAAIIAYTMPVWAALLAWLILGEPLGWAKVAALALGTLGVALLFTPQEVAIGPDKVLGGVMLLAAALLFALGAVIAKRKPLALPPLSAVTWQLGLGSLPLFVISSLWEEVDWAALSPAGWGYFLWMAVGPLGIAYMTWFGALRRLPASTAALGTLLTPVVGTLGAAWLVGEALGWRQWGALACIVLGVALAVRPPPARPRH